MLENRILDNRKSLVLMTRHIDNTDTEFFKYKIAMLEQEIDDMTRQIRYLKGESLNSEPVVIENTYYDNSKMANKLSKEDANKDFEKTFGKSFMGIAASILIFISIILFAMLLLPMFGDGAKMAMMYTVSIAFLGVGAYRLSKDKDDRFNTALTGCGLGALYISLLLSNIYFGVLGDIPLYILIALWGGIVCFLAKNKNYIFQTIGEVGIIIATVFGCMLCIEYKDTARFFALIIFYGITSAIFYIVNYEKEFEKNICYHVFAGIGSVVLTVGCLGFSEDASICLLSTLVIYALNMIGIMSHKLEESKESFGIIASVELFCMAMTSSWLITDEKIWTIVAYVFGMLMIFAISMKKCKSECGLNLIAGTSAAISLIGLLANETVYYYGVVFLMVIPLLVYGYFRRYSFGKYAGLIIMGIYMFVYDLDNKGLHFLFMLVAFIVAYACMFFFKEQYNKDYKCTLHLAALVLIATQMGGALGEVFGDGKAYENIIDTIIYTCFFLLNTMCYKSKFAYDFLTGKKEENEEVYTLANIVAMGWGLILLGDGGLAGCHFVNIIVALAAFMLGTQRMLDKRDDDLASNLYVGGKFTVFLIVVLSSFETPNYVISIACLLLAILLILFGFKGGYKYLRIYGLGLTMISIFKLLMVDITYANTLGNAISFFVSGILCFAISMIYNYLDKKMNR